MEVATGAASTFSLHSRILSPSLSARTVNRNRTIKASRTSNFPSPSAANGTDAGEFAGLTLHSIPLHSNSLARPKPRRSVAANVVIPFSPGYSGEGYPPDLASYFFNERIVYLGMPIVGPVLQLILAELLYLNMQSSKKPVYFYINSTGVIYGDRKVADESDASAVLDMMGTSTAPLYTLAVGNAWGEAAMFLAAGGKGLRAALPSATIMIREPVDRFQGQATDVGIRRKMIMRAKDLFVSTLAKHTQKSIEQIEADTRRPKYFSPSEAIEYGIIDKILYHEKALRKKDDASDLKKEEPQ